MLSRRFNDMCQITKFLDQHTLFLVLFGFVAEDKRTKSLDLPYNVRNEIVSTIIIVVS